MAVKELGCNAWGLWQMHGNVWEWCADPWRDYGGVLVVDPGLEHALDPVLGDRRWRATRGGGWDYGAQHARSACHDAGGPGRRYVSTGFRLALRFQ